MIEAKEFFKPFKEVMIDTFTGDVAEDAACLAMMYLADKAEVYSLMSQADCGFGKDWFVEHFRERFKADFEHMLKLSAKCAKSKPI